MTALLRTEFPFRLPRGYVDQAGNLHQDGVIRLALARDEIEPLSDERTHRNDAYVSILLLSRVIPRLGTVSPVSPAVIEQLFASDFAYLQALYISLNDPHDHIVATQCPACHTRFALDVQASLDK